MGACSGKQIKDDNGDKKPQKNNQKKDEETTIENDSGELRTEETTPKDVSREVKSEEEYNDCIKSGTTLVYFLPKNELNAECSFLKEIATEFESLKFIKVSGNTLKNVGIDTDGLTIPVFNIYKEGELLEKAFDAGNDKEILEKLIKKHI